MHYPAQKHILLFVATLAFASVSLPSSSRAQSYPIDCAILLCLSGGWPASVPCSRARAEFIRRITPWPVEPPLQIWRCPMGASYKTERQPRRIDRIFDALSPRNDHRPRHSFPANHRVPDAIIKAVASSFDKTSAEFIPVDYALRLVRNRADIDISGPEFNFVRSIRVFDVRFASQRIAGENDECRRYALVYSGTYGTKGEFSWAVSTPTALPGAHVGLKGWGSDCPSVYNRSVFVDWHDYEGKYGFEQVNY